MVETTRDCGNSEEQSWTLWLAAGDSCVCAHDTLRSLETPVHVKNTQTPDPAIVFLGPRPVTPHSIDWVSQSWKWRESAEDTKQRSHQKPE